MSTAYERYIAAWEKYDSLWKQLMDARDAELAAFREWTDEIARLTRAQVKVERPDQR